MPLRSTRAVIFDLDGTLVDSLPDIAWHLNAALADAGLATYTDAQIRRWVGGGAAQLVASAVEARANRTASDPGVDDVLARFRTHYRAAPYARTTVFAGLGEALDAIGVKRQLAILSNKPHDLVVTISEALLARWAFREIIGEKSGTPRKPDPTALLAIAGALGVAPAACVLVGDSEIDVATARAAGMPSVAVTWGLCDPDVLADATHIVTTPSELAGLFGPRSR
jgi:phosphoglycolate phosphatase